MSEDLKRKPRTDEGVELDATFRLQSVGGVPIAIVVSGANAGLNRDYKEGIDLLLGRLRSLTAVLVDTYVDSREVKALPLAERRLNAGLAKYPLALGEVEDVAAIRKAFQTSMKKVGQAPDAKGGNGTKLTLAGNRESLACR